MAELTRALSELIRTQEALPPEEAWLSPKFLSIVLLGELGTEEAIPALYANLTFRVVIPYGGYEAKATQVQYPAVQSLSQIGEAATRHALENLKRETRSLRRKLTALVLINVKGRETAEAQIRRLLSSELTVEERERELKCRTSNPSKQ